MAEPISRIPEAFSKSVVPTVAQARPLLAIDCFAGAGGFSLGAIAAGFEVCAAVENDRHASRTYGNGVKNKTARKIKVFQNDIVKLSPHRVLDDSGLVAGRCDLLLGGPPCQGFSSHRLGSAGVDDPRNALLLRYFEYIATVRPRVFLLENVPGLLQPKHASYLQSFLRMAKEHDYDINGPWLLNARDFGVPQNRKRVFILGCDRSRLIDILNWPPVPTHQDPNRKRACGSVRPYRTASDAFRPLRRDDDPNDIHMRHGDTLVEVFKSTPVNGGSRAQSNRVLPCHEAHNGHKDVYGRIDPRRPSPTMTTACINPSKGRFVHPTEHHGITARQAARLQTFPDEFDFEGGLMAAGIQIGNAVPVLLAEALCRTIGYGLVARRESHCRSPGH